ncbi:MAG: MarR family winged helix-turn-helix transcriptional regulator [Dehalococcoidia bacterium]
MEQNPTEAPMTAWRAFLHAYATLIPILEREMKEDKSLPLIWYDVLAQLSDSPQEGRLRMQDLAGSVLLMSPSGLTRLIERMEKEGLVIREHCLEDRRGVFAVITPKGRATLEQAIPGHVRGIQEHFLRHLNDEEIRGLHVALAKVLKAERATGEEWWRLPSVLSDK